MALPQPASVLFLRLRGFLEQSVAEQASRREQLVAAVASAIAPWQAADRVVLEAPDGLAVVGHGDPWLALQAARAAAAAAPEVGIGLHYGPVKAEADPVGGARLAGDGLETAAALAGFDGQRGIVATSPFRDAIAARAPHRARVLRAAGEFVDERLRSHALYAFDPERARRRAWIRTAIGVVGIALILGAGYAARTQREAMEAARRPATITLDVRPQAEVYIDDELKGTTPPLARLSIPPGPHTIELRNERAKPMRMEVQLQPGEELDLKHVFTAPPAPPPRRPAPPKSAFEKARSWVEKQLR